MSDRSPSMSELYASWEFDAPSPEFLASSKALCDLVAKSDGRERTRDEWRAIRHHGTKMHAEADQVRVDVVRRSHNEAQSRLAELSASGLLSTEGL